MNPTRTSWTPEAPLTATKAALLPDGSDRELRTLLYNLFTIGTRMENVRRYMGSRIGISGPQFHLLMAVLELQGTAGVSVGRVAAHLHVAGTFVTAESAKLVRKGYLDKRPDPKDRRVSLLRTRPAGCRAIASILAELQRINDIFFAGLSGQGFRALCAAAGQLVDGSRKVLALIEAVENGGMASLVSQETEG